MLSTLNEWVMLAIGILTILSMLGSFFFFIARSINRNITNSFLHHQQSTQALFRESGQTFDQKLERHAAERRGSMTVLTTEITAINSKCGNMLDYIKEVDQDTKANTRDITKLDSRVSRIEGLDEARYSRHTS